MTEPVTPVGEDAAAMAPDWGDVCNGCGGSFPFLSGPHPTWLPCAEVRRHVKGEDRCWACGCAWPCPRSEVPSGRTPEVEHVGRIYSADGVWECSTNCPHPSHVGREVPPS